jgi:hypothetical protein
MYIIIGDLILLSDGHGSAELGKVRLSMLCSHFLQAPLKIVHPFRRLVHLTICRC